MGEAKYRQGRKGPDGIAWLFVQMVIDVAAVLAAWVRHAVSEMPEPTFLLADRRHPGIADALLPTARRRSVSSRRFSQGTGRKGASPSGAPKSL